MHFFKDRFDFPSTDVTIGLDIGTHTIKWVSLGSNQELIQYAIQGIPIPLTIAQSKDIPQIAKVLKKTLLNQDCIKNCIINIPDTLVCCKWVQLDNVDYQNIELLAEKLIPYPLCKVYFDYQVFDQPVESKKKYNVLLVACRREHLDFRLEVIQQANLIPSVVELSSFALERAYSFFYSNKLIENFILLDIGATQLTFLFFIHSQPTVFCENLFNDLDPECILLQIKRCIKRYLLSYPYYEIKKLLLIGANISSLNYLLSKLNEVLKIQIRILEYPKQLRYYPELSNEILERDFLNLFLSYGLALRSNS